MKIVLISDSHSETQNLHKLKAIFQAQTQIDAIIFMGDATNIECHELLHKTAEQKQQLNALFSEIQLITNAPIYYILGNHETEQGLIESDTIHYIGNQAIEICGVKIIALSGSTSSPTFDEGKQSAIIGYPFSQFFTKDEIVADQQFMSELCLLDTILKLRNGSLNEAETKIQIRLQSEKLKHNEQQYIIADELLSKETAKVVVLSHQGPLCSLTSIFSHPRRLKITANGSLSYDKIKDKFSDKILCWIHGHTHYPLQFKDENVFSTGIFCTGHVGILEISTQGLINYQIIRLK